MLELVFLLVIFAGIFFVMLYMPTVLLVNNKHKKKDKHESILLFVAISMLFMLLSYLFASFFLLKSEPAGSIFGCDWFANFICIFNNDLTRIVNPSPAIYFMLLMQIAVSYWYSYFAYNSVVNYSDRARTLVGIVLFFIVAVGATILSVVVLYKVAFVGGLKYISLFLGNAYAILPLFYLMTIIYKNREKLRRK